MLESLHYSIIPPLNPPSYLTPPPTLVVQLLWNRLMISSLMVTRSLIHYHHLPTFVLSIATCAMVMPSKHDALPLEPLLDLLRTKYVADPVEWMSPSDESILRDKMAPIDKTATGSYVLNGSHQLPLS